MPHCNAANDGHKPVFKMQSATKKFYERKVHRMLNQKIKKYMEDRGIKQSFLKERLGMTASTVNALLNGNRGISAEEYFKICAALNVPLDYFSNTAATVDNAQ